jgi:hypothetical protein
MTRHQFVYFINTLGSTKANKILAYVNTGQTIKQAFELVTGHSELPRDFPYDP